MNNETDLISGNYRVQKSDEIIAQAIKDGTIILNTKSERYLGLDQMGTNFWNVLVKAESIRHAYDQMLKEYDVDPKVLYDDMNDFLQRLIDSKLIKISKT